MEIVQLFISLGLIDVSGVPFFAFIFKNSLYSGVFAMIGGLILVPVISLLTRKSKPAGTEEMFACYGEKKTVEITDSLGK